MLRELGIKANKLVVYDNDDQPTGGAKKVYQRDQALVEGEQATRVVGGQTSAILTAAGTTMAANNAGNAGMMANNAGAGMMGMNNMNMGMNMNMMNPNMNMNAQQQLLMLQMQMQQQQNMQQQNIYQQMNAQVSPDMARMLELPQNLPQNKDAVKQHLTSIFNTFNPDQKKNMMIYVYQKVQDFEQKTSGAHLHQAQTTARMSQFQQQYGQQYTSSDEFRR